MAEEINGTNQDDVLDGDVEENLIRGFGGSDRLSGQAASDTLVGGDGNDTLSGGNDQDILWGEDGNDSLAGDAGDDLLYGGAVIRFAGNAGCSRGYRFFHAGLGEGCRGRYNARNTYGFSRL